MKKVFFYRVCVLSFLIVSSFMAQSQNSPPRRKFVEFIVTPSHGDWNYIKGEPAYLNINANAGGAALNNVQVDFSAGKDNMKADTSGTVIMHDGRAMVYFGTMDEPGFRYCNIHFKYLGKNYKEKVKVSFSPEKIEPTVEYPGDFMRFWNKERKNSLKVPMNVEVIPQPDLSTDKVAVSLVKIQRVCEGDYFYGYLSEPKKRGTHPALLVPPGAGIKRIHPNYEYPENGFITFSIEVHGLNPQCDDSTMKEVRTNLENYLYDGISDKKDYYYKKVYLGCLRANDFLCSLPSFDGRNLGVTGGSQGGALSIVTAGLDKRIRFVSAFYPALCDMTGYLYGRVGGWPKIFRDKDLHKFPVDIDVAKKTLSYYDVVNFARQISVPGFYSYGYNDNTCSPTTVCSALNTIKASKKIVITPSSGHWRFVESNNKSIEWMKMQLN